MLSTAALRIDIERAISCVPVAIPRSTTHPVVADPFANARYKANSFCHYLSYSAAQAPRQPPMSVAYTWGHGTRDAHQANYGGRRETNCAGTSILLL